LNELDALRSEVDTGKEEVEGFRSEVDTGKEEVEGLRSEVDTGKKEMQGLRKELQLLQAAREYDTLDVNWVVDPAALKIGVNLYSQSFKLRHDVKLQLETVVRDKGCGFYINLQEGGWVPLGLNGSSITVWPSARHVRKGAEL
jgi:predicted nuclease with TOPRIM domain